MENEQLDPKREARRRYEETHREERKKRNKFFSTYLPTAEMEEINNFLKEYKVSKVELVRAGYKVLKKEKNGNDKNEINGKGQP